MTPIPGYNVRRAAQVAAFFALKENKQQINVLKLVKLMYLSDREHLEQYDTPILYERVFKHLHKQNSDVLAEAIEQERRMTSI